MSHSARNKPRVALRAVIRRADGTTQDLGVISDSHRPWRALPGYLRIWRANHPNGNPLAAIIGLALCVGAVALARLRHRS